MSIADSRASQPSSPRDLLGRRVLVAGLARSGRAAAELCVRLGARVTCTDLRSDLSPVPGCEMVLGRHRPEDFLGAELIVVSPGIPANQEHLAAAAAAGVPIVSELAFAAERIRAPILAITGTNGKSTVTWFCGQILVSAGWKPFVGGNIGRPLSEALLGPQDAFDIVVAEVSSYQMEWPGRWAPRAACILNLTPDHLARHGTMETYAEMKCRLFDRMGPGDLAVLPAGQPLLVRIAQGRGGRRAWLGDHPGVRLEGDTLALSDETLGTESVSLAGFQVAGVHNRWNAAAAVLLVWWVGTPASRIHPEVLSPLAHRLEPVARVDDVLWINDSKATNVAAARVGIEAVDRPLVLLLGGQGKAGEDFGQLQGLIPGARAVICFGQTGPLIARALAKLSPHQVPRMTEAMVLAAQLARPGDAVLLSPACASFDEFRDFEHRGDVFRQWVLSMAAGRRSGSGAPSLEEERP
jgi:UDP-N-acetylmuramoylalanine--D-glutamate ligase